MCADQSAQNLWTGSQILVKKPEAHNSRTAYIVRPVAGRWSSVVELAKVKVREVQADACIATTAKTMF